MAETEVNEGEFHDVEDAIGAYRVLSDRERVNFTRVAEFLAGRGNIASAGELLSEAYIRIATGKRRWRKEHTFPQFVAGLIKSLASDGMFLTDARKVRALTGSYTVLEGDELMTVADGSDGSVVDQKVEIEKMYAHMEASFPGDEEMGLLVMGVQDHMRGRVLETFVGVDTKRLAALRTRFNRELNRYIAERCAKEGRAE